MVGSSRKQESEETGTTSSMSDPESYVRHVQIPLLLNRCGTPHVLCQPSMWRTMLLVVEQDIQLLYSTALN
jgi:hypothetical protein